MSKPDKYFLCFGFSNFSPKDLKPFHVTLIYFGELTPTEILKVGSRVSQYIEDLHRHFYLISGTSITFDRVEMFGKDNDIRVLTPDPEHLVTKILKVDVNRLLKHLVEFRKHNDFPFNPHITTDLHSFTGRLNKLYLCKNNYEVVDSWDLRGNE